MSGEDPKSRIKEGVQHLENMRKKCLANNVSNVLSATDMEEDPPVVKKLKAVLDSDDEESEKPTKKKVVTNKKRKLEEFKKYESEESEESDESDVEKIDNMKETLKHHTNDAAHREIVTSDSEDSQDMSFDEDDDNDEEVEKNKKLFNDSDSDSEEESSDLPIEEPEKKSKVEKSRARQKEEKAAARASKKPKKATTIHLNQVATTPADIFQDIAHIVGKDPEKFRTIVPSDKDYHILSNFDDRDQLKLAVRVVSSLPSLFQTRGAEKIFKDSYFLKTIQRGIIQKLILKAKDYEDYEGAINLGEELLKNNKATREEEIKFRKICADHLKLLQESVTYPTARYFVDLAIESQHVKFRTPMKYYESKFKEHGVCVITGLPLHMDQCKVAEISIDIGPKRAKRIDSDYIRLPVFAGPIDNKLENADKLVNVAIAAKNFVRTVLFLIDPNTLFDEIAYGFLQTAKFKKVHITNPVKSFISSREGVIKLIKAALSFRGHIEQVYAETAE